MSQQPIDRARAGHGCADAPGGPSGGRVAHDEVPTPVPTEPSPTQIPDPVWGKYNDPRSLLYLCETNIVEL